MNNKEVTASSLPVTLAWQGASLYLLDQTRLPAEEKIIKLTDFGSLLESITMLRVRGAPAIGVAAAYGMLLGLQDSEELEVLIRELNERGAQLKASRPTAVNLAWAVDRMIRCAEVSLLGNVDARSLWLAMEKEAILIHHQDTASCETIAETGLHLVERFPRVLTHCNAGALAVTGKGTALAPVHLAHERGMNVHVWVDETRPLLQGARLTAFELGKAGVAHTLITDSMAASLMQKGEVDMVMVGADRVAANGDTANKIGTLSLAVNCHYFDVPFYVVAPFSTFDGAIDEGEQIIIEQRKAEEVSTLAGVVTAPATTPVYNPAFDVTPAALITGWVTDRGLFENLSDLQEMLVPREVMCDK